VLAVFARSHGLMRRHRPPPGDRAWARANL